MTAAALARARAHSQLGLVREIILVPACQRAFATTRASQTLDVQLLLLLLGGLEGLGWMSAGRAAQDELRVAGWASRAPVVI